MLDQTQRERSQQDAPWNRGAGGPFDGPRRYKIEKPDTDELLKRMRHIDSDRARRFRQRSGQ